MGQRVRASKPIQSERRPKAPAITPTADEKRHKFVLLYFKNPNGSEAARAAGYTGTDASITTTASRLLADAKVQAQLDALRQRAQERTEITAEKLLRELGKIAFANMGDYVTIQGNKDPQIDLSALTPEQWAAVEEVQTETYWDEAAEKEVKRVKIKLHSKLGAIEKAMKHLGMFDKRRGGNADDENPEDGEPQAVHYTLNIAGHAAIQIRDGRPQIAIGADQDRPKLAAPTPED